MKTTTPSIKPPTAPRNPCIPAGPATSPKPYQVTPPGPPKKGTK